MQHCVHTISLFYIALSEKSKSWGVEIGHIATLPYFAKRRQTNFMIETRDVTHARDAEISSRV